MNTYTIIYVTPAGVVKYAYLDVITGGTIKDTVENYLGIDFSSVRIIFEGCCVEEED